MKLDDKKVVLAGIAFVSGFVFCAIVLSPWQHPKSSESIRLTGPAVASSNPEPKVPAPLQLAGGQKASTFDVLMAEVFRAQESITVWTNGTFNYQVQPEEMIWWRDIQPARNTDLIDFRVQAIPLH